MRSHLHPARLWLSGLTLVLVLAFGAAPAHARTMTLQTVSIDTRNGFYKPPEWTLPPRDEMSSNFPAGRARFVFPLPALVPDSGAQFPLTLETTGTNYAPGINAAGATVRGGRVNVSNYAQSGNPTPVTLPPASKPVTLDPALAPAGATSTQVLISHDYGEGPTYTYTYALADTPAPAPSRPTPVTINNATNATVTPAIAFGFPPARRCVSRRNFLIRLVRPPRVRYLAAKVNVNGRQVAVTAASERYITVRGRALLRRRLTARVDLRGLPKGTFRVQIVAVTTSLRTIRGTRTYRTCAGKRRVGLPEL